MTSLALRTRRATVSVSRAVLGIAVAWIFGLAQSLPARADGDFPLSSLKRCGETFTTEEVCRPDGQCSEIEIFEVRDAWHGLAQCLRAVRNAWNSNGADATVPLPGSPSIRELALAQIRSEMARPRVRFATAGATGGETFSFAEAYDPQTLQPRRPYDRVLLTNEIGVPYNSMGQTGLAYFLYQLAGLAAREADDPTAQTEASFYRALGRAAAETVITPVAEGGLATETACAEAPSERCAWYHSITRRDRPSNGGATLNQMLHAVRDFGMMADLAEKRGLPEADVYEAAFRAGLNQLFLSAGYSGPGTAPRFSDFMQTAAERGPPLLFYGYNSLASGVNPGYYLPPVDKNCHYHNHSLSLLHVISERTGGLWLSEFTALPRCPRLKRAS